MIKFDLFTRRVAARVLSASISRRWLCWGFAATFQFAEEAGDFARLRDAAWSTALRLPQIAIFVLPLAALIGSAAAFRLLAARREMLAARACGYSPRAAAAAARRRRRFWRRRIFWRANTLWLRPKTPCEFWALRRGARRAFLAALCGCATAAITRAPGGSNSGPEFFRGHFDLSHLADRAADRRHRSAARALARRRGRGGFVLGFARRARYRSERIVAARFRFSNFEWRGGLTPEFSRRFWSSRGRWRLRICGRRFRALATTAKAPRLLSRSSGGGLC